MKKIFVAGIAAAAFCGAPAMAADMPTKAPMAPAPVYVGGFFGEVTGAYAFKNGVKDWMLFGPGISADTKQGLGAGWTGRVLAGYRWGTWDIAGAAQYGKFTNGDYSDPANIGKLSAKMQAYDAQVGYHMMLASTDARLALGIRYAKWDNTVDAGFTRFVEHDWRGVGPRAELSTITPLTPSMQLHAGVGAAALFGKLDTTSTPNWICVDCSSSNTTTANLDGSIGLGFTVFQGAQLVVGYKAEYWSNVNVAITDNSGGGLNQGTSAALSHGPFFSLKLGGAP